MSNRFNIELVRPLLKTKPNEAFFWSGTTSISLDTKMHNDLDDTSYETLKKEFGGAEVAKRIAKKFGGKTLEMIIDENLDAFLEAGFPYYENDFAKTQYAWEAASEAFAAQASGDVHLVFGMDENSLWGDIYSGVSKSDTNFKTNEYTSIWDRIELQQLRKNPRIKGVTVIDPFTQAESEYFSVPHQQKYTRLRKRKKDQFTQSSDTPPVTSTSTHSSISSTPSTNIPTVNPPKDTRLSLLTACMTCGFVIAAVITFFVQDEGYFLSKPLSWIGTLAIYIAELFLLKHIKLLKATASWTSALLILFILHLTIIPYSINEILATVLFLAVGLFVFRFFSEAAPNLSTVHTTKIDEYGHTTTETKQYIGDIDSALNKAEQELRSEGYNDITIK